MLLTINRDALLKPLLLVSGFVERKQTTPILSNVFIRKAGNELTLISNDTEIQASVHVNTQMHGEDFTITLPAKKLQDILKVFAENTKVVFIKENSKIVITSGTTKFTLQSMPADNYPLLRVSDAPIYEFTLGQNILKNMISKVQYAMADKDSRTFLNGMLFEVKNNQLRLVATDAHRLGFIAAPLTNAKECSATIPRKTIIELYKMLEDDPSSIKITFYPSQVCFEAQGKQLITRIIDGRYPDYERVIPLNNDKLCLIKTTDLLQAIERVAVIGIDKLKSVNFDISKNLLTLSCRNEEQEDSYDEVAITYAQNEQLRVSFNLHYIRDLLVNSHAEYLQWAFYDNQRSVLITIPEEADFKTVIMPLRT